MTTIDLNFGALAPVTDEVDLDDIQIIGEIPRELNGLLVRNGPNPLLGRFEGNTVLDWWPQAAMLHGIAFHDGRVTWYRNRWARTQRWAEVYDPNRAASFMATNPNVNVVHHAGEILALAEGAPPLAITADLETIGKTRRHLALAEGMTAHPKIDPNTNELIYFKADWHKPYLRYGVTDAQGNQIVNQEIEMASASIMHDMAITETHSIMLDLNVAYDFLMLSRGHRMPLRWHEDREAKIGVIPRHGGKVRWFPIAPCFIQHVVNAYDESASLIVLDAVRYPRYFVLQENGTTFEDSPLGVLWRYVIDLNNGTVTEKQIDDIGIELPRINETRTGRSNRFFYAAEQPTNTEIRGIVRYDFKSSQMQRHRILEGDQNSEPVFVPRPSASNEDDGWVLVCVYRHKTDTSDVLIIDGKDIANDPIATVRLPRRIPAGFHGAWLPTDCPS
jgi:carotenoid cleavage dioxygenase